MSRFSNLAVALALALAIGCATHVAVTPTHHENMAAQAKVLAIAARDLEDIVRHQHAQGAAEEATHAVIDFHAQAENFAGTTEEWQSDDRVSNDYELLIKTWVKVKQTFPNLSADKLTQDAYGRVQHEWEKLERTSGYADRAYEKKIEQGK
jgi:plasmid stabilization system protein ParE